MKRFVLAILASTLTIVTPALADDNAVLEALKKASDQIENLTQRLEVFEKKPGGKVVPAGAVMAFDLPNGCPKGWTEFTPAAGRFIIAVDGDKYTLPYIAGKPDYQRHGEETIKLSIQEMPKHLHGYMDKHFHADNGGWSLAGGNNNFNSTGLAKSETQLAGGHDDIAHGESAPHNNMPPYIALYMCKKD